MLNVTLEDFFSKKFETESTNILIESPRLFSSSLMENYLCQLMKHPTQAYLDYLVQHPVTDEITSRDITQLSSLEDCTTKMCINMLELKNKGFTYVEIAKFLHGNLHYTETTGALTKYGENQVKTASQLGLTTFRKELWFLSGIGAIICNVSEETKQKYLALNLLRDPFYSKIILSLRERDTNLKNFMTILSESTQKRRSSSCTKVLSFFLNQCEVEGITLHNLIFK